MAVSKRTRFEVLRRDEYTCQYCGETAPDVKITVDHVMPVALGGSDFPSNLVAACGDCNAGKTSITPESPLVEKVSGAAADFAVRSTDAATKLRAFYEESSDFVFEFEEQWGRWQRTGSQERIPLPVDWRDSIRQWWRIGVPEEVIHEAIEIAMRKRDLRHEYGEFRYMAGIVWKKLEQAGIGGDAQINEPAVYTESEVDSITIDREQRQFYLGWDEGFNKCTQQAMEFMLATDAVMQYVDGGKVLSLNPRVVSDGA